MSIEFTTLTITGLEVWCLFNSANLSCQSHTVWLLWRQAIFQVQKSSGAWNKIQFNDLLFTVLWVQFSLEVTLFIAETFLKLLDVNFKQKCEKC